MFYTPKIQKAIKFANKVHQNQTRKNKPHEPYILHPIGVGLILARAGGTEDMITAGILHDTIEDCVPYGSVTRELIEKEFGIDVARMVNDVTEQDPTLPWDERKRLALEHIKKMNKDSIILKSADALNNLSDLLIDIETEGENAYNNFNSSKDKVIIRFNALVRELEKAYPGNPLIPELKVGVDKI